ncbi:MAG: flippase [Methanotrichaceae archaeon]
MPESKKFAFDVGLTFIATAVNMLLGIAISVMLGRLLGAEDLGLYREVTTIYSIALVVGALGVTGSITKYIAEFKSDPKRLNKIASAGVLSLLLFGFGTLAVIFLLSDWLAEFFNMPQLSFLFKVISIIFPFALLSQAFVSLVVGLREMKLYAAYTIIQSILMGLTTFSLIHLGFGVMGATAGLVISSAVSSVFILLVARGYFSIDLDDYSSTIGELLKFSGPIFLANIVGLINTQADIVLIGHFLSPSNVGFYSVAIGISRLLWVIPQSIQTITYPATAEYWAHKDQPALQKMFDKSMKYTACIISFPGLFFAFFAPEILTAIYGNGFIASVTPMRILLVGTIVYGTMISIGSSVTGAGRPDLGLKLGLISAVTDLILNLILIPYIGIIGAAIATVVSLIIATALGVYLTVKILAVKLDMQWYLIMMALIALSLIGYSALNELGNQIISGIVVLCIYAFAVGSLLIKSEDRLFIFSLIQDITHRIRIGQN